MGYSATAIAVYGVQVHASQLYAKASQRGCHHEIDDHMNFCPVCGKPAFVSKRKLLLDTDSSKELSIFASDYAGLKDESATVLLGFLLSSTGYKTDLRAIPNFNKEEMDEEIRRFCKQYSLQIDSSNQEAKIHVMIQHSY